MDILIRLRLLLWAMVISLWGLMVYQLLEEDKQENTQMRWVAKQNPQQEEESLPALDDQPRIPAEQLFPPKPETDDLTHPATPVQGTQTGGKLARIPSSLGTAPAQPIPPAAMLPTPTPELKNARPLAPDARTETRPAETAPSQPKPERKAVPETRPEQRPEAQVPTGFVKAETRHFTIYAESQPPSLEFLETLENLHANLMLDLSAFSPWARDERVSIFLFRSQESYRKVTGRPAWSGGASSVKRRKIYIYESEELVGILAHELTHIYFDSFFLAAGGNPLWLSEGMATLVQTERGLAAPNWLAHNLSVLRRGGGYHMMELMKVEDTSKASDDDIRLWYSQAYSIVRFLIRTQYRSSFYKFCKFLRDGAVVDDALYRAYGMPFNRVKALEYAWRGDLEAGKLQ